MTVVFRLDDYRDGSGVVIVTVNGVPIVLSHARVCELLQREAQFLATLAEPLPTEDAGEEPRPLPRPAKVEPTPERLKEMQQIPDSITHASLSTRIKKVYEYSARHKKLRPAMLEILEELIQSFDWRLPDHPNSRLDVQLLEMLSWGPLPEASEKRLRAFLTRYQRARSKIGA